MVSFLFSSSQVWMDADIGGRLARNGEGIIDVAFARLAY